MSTLILEDPAGWSDAMQFPHAYSDHPLRSQVHGRLRPYQLEAWAAGRKCLGNRRRVHVISLPTGAGKTVVACALVAHYLATTPNARVLWLAPNWELLAQASQAWDTFSGGDYGGPGRIGGRPKYPGLPPERDAQVEFTTLSTWYSRRAGARWQRARGGNLLIIVDESHWGQDAKQGRALRDAFLGRATLIGLTATPRLTADERDEPIFRRTYADLCPRDGNQESYLARPTVLTVPTGCSWDPILQAGAIHADSLMNLAERASRNDLIAAVVDHHVAAKSFRSGILFACNIKHADLLQDQLQERGVRAGLMHQDRRQADNDAALQAFRNGSLDVLLNVDMLTHGIDIPQVDGIILARPTGSMIQLAQMVGRGSRLAKGKDSYVIIEFGDTLTRNADRVFHSRDYFGDAADVATPTPRRRTLGSGRPTRHSVPASGSRFEQFSSDKLPAMPFLPGQTFGVEMELAVRCLDISLTNRKLRRLAHLLLEELRKLDGVPVDSQLRAYHGYKDYSQWRVTLDGSCGLEVISPILEGSRGLEELCRVLQAIHKVVRHEPDLKIDHRCGLHLTLATRFTTYASRRSLLDLLTRLEAGLFTLAPPSRLFDFDGSRYNRRGRNPYCRPLRETLRRSTPNPSGESQWPNRYHSVRLGAEENGLQLVEIRINGGTTDYRKAIPQLCLYMVILNHHRKYWQNGRNTEWIFPGGNQRIIPKRADQEDIFCLLAREGIYLHAGLADQLWERRRQLRRYWAQVIPKRASGWLRAGWYDVLRKPSAPGARLLQRRGVLAGPRPARSAVGAA